MILQICYYALSVVGIIKKRSRALTFMMLVMMWIVFGLNTYNGDFGNYNWIYINIRNPIYWTEFEPLFNIIMYICNIAGLSFIQFRMVFGALYVLILYITVHRFTENIPQVLGFYMLFPYLMFTSVIRSGFANILIVLAYYEVFAGRDNKARFWFFIILASLIQYTSIFFVVYFFLKSKELKRIFLMIVPAFLGIVFVAYYSKMMYNIVSLMTSSYRTLKWFVPENSVQKSKWVLYLIVIDLLILFMAYLSKKENTNSSLKNPYAEDVFYLCASMLIFIPTFFITNASSRVLWELLLPVIISYAKDDEIRRHNNVFNLVTISRKDIILLIVLMAFSLYANLPYRGGVNDARLIFHNNLIYCEAITQP